uniref:Uncharacterized protein n=2 Tax=unclassified Caudoviricetes TaxID=2788787 RepID=A0A8S5QMX2_9CAUD|nr:MAG TPA: hypothetical protein [Siphoviridae sp. ctV7t52]DAF86119.1 MAG TPA: hypothetical protein [Siphoviridae sp. ctnX725]DAS77001.1 MAG TPA: hypothetical protein [Caudoviricetes sp.]
MSQTLIKKLILKLTIFLLATAFFWVVAFDFRKEQ